MDDNVFMTLNWCAHITAMAGDMAYASKNLKPGNVCVLCEFTLGGMEDMSSGEVASMCGSGSANVSGSRIKENPRSLFYFGSANILKVKVNSCYFYSKKC